MVPKVRSALLAGEVEIAGYEGPGADPRGALEVSFCAACKQSGADEDRPSLLSPSYPLVLFPSSTRPSHLPLVPPRAGNASSWSSSRRLFPSRSFSLPATLRRFR